MRRKCEEAPYIVLVISISYTIVKNILVIKSSHFLKLAKLIENINPNVPFSFLYEPASPNTYNSNLFPVNHIDRPQRNLTTSVLLIWTAQALLPNSFFLTLIRFLEPDHSSPSIQQGNGRARASEAEEYFSSIVLEYMLLIMYVYIQ